MKILLAQNATYVPAFGGANKSNRILLEAFSARGHECHALSACHANGGIRNIEVDIFNKRGVTIHAVHTMAVLDTENLKKYFMQLVGRINPDWIFISSEDIGQVLLEAAAQINPAKVIYLARTTLFLPFGPDCYIPIPEKTRLLAKIRGIVTVGDYLKDYMKQHAGLEAAVLPISLFGAEPFPFYGKPFPSAGETMLRGYVTMLNPCAYKGLKIFLGLASLFPDVAFAAVPTWGTTAEDLEAMKAFPNITILEPEDEIDLIYRRSKTILVPSLWAEAKSRTIVEAMLRGIPVLASDIGGNREAKLGVPYALPVRPITTYEEMCNDRSQPIAHVPEQDMSPWHAALHRLVDDGRHYLEIAERSQKAALDYVRLRGGCEQVESYLAGLAGKPMHHPAEAAATDVTPARALSDPQKRALLALRLQEKYARRDKQDAEGANGKV